MVIGRGERATTARRDETRRGQRQQRTKRRRRRAAERAGGGRVRLYASSPPHYASVVEAPLLSALCLSSSLLCSFLLLLCCFSSRRLVVAASPPPLLRVLPARHLALQPFASACAAFVHLSPAHPPLRLPSRRLSLSLSLSLSRPSPPFFGASTPPQHRPHVREASLTSSFPPGRPLLSCLLARAHALVGVDAACELVSGRALVDRLAAIGSG